MKFPSKVTPYKASLISKFPAVLAALHDRDLSPADLYAKVKSRVDDIGEFFEIICCLYVLDKIDLITDDEVLHYVERDTMR